MKPLFSKVTIIGVGLIGGSMGMALKSRGLADRVTGVDIDPANLGLALEIEAIDEGSMDITTACSDADLVVVATPVGLTVEIIKKIAPALPKDCIVTDVASTKGSVVREAEKLMPPDRWFVGGHPMTGSEIAGAGGADRYLFENAVYILTPSQQTTGQALAKLEKMIDGLGSRVIKIDPDEHDLMVAAVSHLPHLIATTLVNTVGAVETDHPGVLMLAAGGFRDTTRIASGHPLMWRDICLTNKENILEALDRFSESLQKTRQLIAACDDKGLADNFAQARSLRNNIPAKLRGYLPQAYEVIVTVPDRPGIISSLASVVGKAGININDIEILRVREGEGGTIRLGFGSEEEQLRALSIYRLEGISAKKR